MEEKDKAIDIVPPLEESPVFFLVNPNDFQPNGLVPVIREGSSKGPFITWMLGNEMVFRWDANTTKPNGSHYHINGIRIRCMGSWKYNLFYS